MSGLGNILAGIFVVLGSGFALVAAIGILRLPDFYTRIHAASKAGTVGSVLALVALAIVSVETAEILRAIAAIVFFFLTAPISAHLLGKAAYSAGYHMWEGSVLDEMPNGPSLPPELRRQREEREKHRPEAGSRGADAAEPEGDDPVPPGASGAPGAGPAA